MNIFDDTRKSKNRMEQKAFGLFRSPPPALLQPSRRPIDTCVYCKPYIWPKRRILPRHRASKTKKAKAKAKAKQKTEGDTYAQRGKHEPKPTHPSRSLSRPKKEATWPFYPLRDPGIPTKPQRLTMIGGINRLRAIRALSNTGIGSCFTPVPWTSPCCLVYNSGHQICTVPPNLQLAFAAVILHFSSSFFFVPL